MRRRLPGAGRFLRALAGFAVRDSPRRNILGPWFARDVKPGLFRIMKPQESALQVRGLTKRFDRLAVDSLDLTVRTGEFYALVGPNGAGKTTTLRMVAGLSPPDAGSVAVFGIDALSDPVAAKQMMAWVSDEPMIYDKLTPLEYLAFVAGLWGSIPSFRSLPRTICWSRSDSSRICMNAVKDFPRACARRWRWREPWCMTPA